MVFSYCKCSRFMAGNPEAAANFYNNNFIPRGWELNYSKLSDCGAVILTGYCKKCHKELDELIPLPKGLSGDALLKSIYDTVQAAHPYDKFNEHVGYYGKCKERSEFYQIRDKHPQIVRSKEFLNLFHDYDREAAYRWLEKNFPPQSPMEVLRDTGGSLFCTVVRMARENGDLAKADAILDYIIPSAKESDINEKVKLTAYEFNFESTINYGCEGIYMDCCLVGKFDESGRFVLHVGTLKTLKRDLEAAKIMGELSGTLMHYVDLYVNQNIHRFMPEEQLRAQNQMKKESDTSC